MNSDSVEGVVTAQEKFIFPDDSGVMPKNLYVTMARNGRPGIQMVFSVEGRSTVFELSGAGFHAEWFQMLAVPVEYNTGDGESQGGNMVIQAAEKPEYAIRKAPFAVYDCLRPASNGVIESVDGKCAMYCCLVPDDDISSGTYNLTVSVRNRDLHYDCAVEVRVYDVDIPSEHFEVTNWFLLSSISERHHVSIGTPQFDVVLRRYIQAMRRARQTMFYIMFDERCVSRNPPYAFDFEYLRPIIQSFFDEGMHTLELGQLLSRGRNEDGSPDMMTGRFRCAMAPHIDFDSREGYAFTAAFLQSLAQFLKANDWQNDVAFHIHDEPDVHYPNQQVLEERRRQYYQAASMVKKYLPNARIIEAVKTDAFRGGIDILVPTTSGYEAYAEEFDNLRDCGDEVWNYVCCEPEGKWLNRFLDQKVNHSRLLFWGFEHNRITGFLHWGFNQFPDDMNPFEGTSCHNPTGLGTNFPCGDAFIVYPGDDGPWLSMRLEAERRGTEDLELLRMLRERNPRLHDQLIGRLFRNNHDYTDDESVFDEVYEQLLAALSE